MSFKISFSIVYSLLALVPVAAFAALGFSPPIPISTEPTSSENSPAVAADGHGNWVSVFEQTWSNGNGGNYKYLRVSRSTDNGKTWSAAASLDPSNSTAVYYEAPCLATDGEGHWVAVWSRYRGVKVSIRDFEFMVSRSSDVGATWTAPSILNSGSEKGHNTILPPSAEPTVAVDGNGNWFAAWQGASVAADVSTYAIRVAKSTDNGVTWSTPVLVGLGTGYFFSHHPHLIAFPSGELGILWNSSPFSFGNLANHVYFSRSEDAGASWSVPLAVISHTDEVREWHELTQVAVGTDGSCVAVGSHYMNLLLFTKDTTPFAIRSDDSGATWTGPVDINAGARENGFDENNPQVAADASGNWVAIWDARPFRTPGYIDAEVEAAVSNDNGVSWHDAVTIDAKAKGETNIDKMPGLATDGVGHWVVVANRNNSEVIAYASNFTESDGLYLLSPLGRERYRIGQPLPIQWLSVGNPADSVNITLLRRGAFIAQVAASAPNSGQFEWTIPSTITPGGGYRVIVTSHEQPTLSSRGDQRFSIRKPLN